MTAVGTVSFWLVYGIVVTVISGIYIYRLERRLGREQRRAERYREKLEAVKWRESK